VQLGLRAARCRFRAPVLLDLELQCGIEPFQLGIALFELIR